jgi:hypothetical protein
MLIHALRVLAEKLQFIEDADRIPVGHKELLRLVDTVSTTAKPPLHEIGDARDDELGKD